MGSRVVASRCHFRPERWSWRRRTQARSGTRRDSARAAAIGWVPLLQPLPLDAREVLAARASLKTYGPGEAVVRKGEASLELFLIERGTVVVELPHNGGGAAELARLGPASASGRWGFSPASQGRHRSCRHAV